MQNQDEENLIDTISNYSNEELLDEFVTLAQGDDYDGCFTINGEREMFILATELKRRLINIGFLTTDSKLDHYFFAND